MRHTARRPRGGLVITLALLAAATGCEDPTAPEGDGTLRLILASATPDPAERNPAPPGILRLRGLNGVLEITDIRMVFGELRLRPADEDADCAEEEAACRAIAGGPFAVDLPLGGGDVEIGSQSVPADEYGLLRITAEDLLGDEDDGISKAQAIGRLAGQLRRVYPDLPLETAMIVAGTFAGLEGERRDFTVYFRGEAPLEFGLGPGLAFEDGEERRLILHLDPALWFRVDGAVRDLSTADGALMDFPFDVADAFTGVEIPADPPSD